MSIFGHTSSLESPKVPQEYHPPISTTDLYFFKHEGNVGNLDISPYYLLNASLIFIMPVPIKRSFLVHQISALTLPK